MSTRKVRDITEALCGTSFSKRTVSRLVGSLDADLRAWRERRLTMAYPYLLVDARYEHVRVNGQVVSQGVLVVKGVREDGLRELLAVEVADTENAVTYEDLFRRLKDRGLRGVKLVTSDDHRGLVNAIRKHFQGVSWQRCQVHMARNALGKVGRKHQRTISADVRAVFNAPSVEWARELKAEVVERWARTHLHVAEWLETALEDGLACFAFPEAHRRRIRSTNGLECQRTPYCRVWGTSSFPHWSGVRLRNLPLLGRVPWRSCRSASWCARRCSWVRAGACGRSPGISVSTRAPCVTA